MSRSRITYRIEQRKQPAPNEHSRESQQPSNVIPLYEDEYRIMEAKNSQQLNHFATDYGAWSSPFDAETERIERIIRESNEQQANSTRANVREAKPERQASLHIPQYAEEDDLMELQDPDVTGNSRLNQRSVHMASAPSPAGGQSFYRGPSVTGPRYVRHTSTSLWKFIMYFSGAAATGILLGIFVLTIFSQPSTPKNTDFTAGTGKDSNPSSAIDTGDKANDGAAAPVSAALDSAVAVQLPERAYMVLQNGGFSTNEAANAAKLELQKIGIPAVSEAKDKYFVYAGFAVDKTASNQLKSLLEAKGIEIYAKPYIIPAMNELRWSGDAASIQQYLEKSDRLIQSISGITVIHLEETAPTVIDEATMESFLQIFTEWEAAEAAIATETPERIKESWATMNTSMRNAKTALEQYRLHVMPAHLWEAQQHITQFVVSEQQMLQQLAVN